MLGEGLDATGRALVMSICDGRTFLAQHRNAAG